MGKKFTSFLVLAALLLAVPAHAQFVKKAAKQQITTLSVGPAKTIDVQKAKELKEKYNDSTVGIDFTGAMHQQIAKATLLETAINNIQEDKAVFEKQMEENFRAVQQGKAASVLNKGVASAKAFVSPRVVTFDAEKAPARRASNRAEVVDDHGVITSPAEGESKLYDRSGFGYYVSNQQLNSDQQGGKAEIVEAADGVVYIKDFISHVGTGAWVKGTKEDNKITIPAGQIIFYATAYGLRIAKCAYVEGTGWTEVAGDITLTVDGNTISLDDTDEDHPVAAFWTDDNSFSGYGDYETVFSYDPDYVAPQPIVLPDGATVETWYQDQVVVGSQGDEDGFAKVAFVGDDVYLSGIFKNFPDSWIKGTIDGTTVTFSGLQFLGNYSSYEIYATGSDGLTYSSTLQDFKMTYDATAKTLTSVNTLLANAKKDAVYYLEAYNNIVISKDAPEEPTAITGANVDAVPYANALNSADLFADFGVIDSNKDGSTWSYDSSYGTIYKWNTSNNGDDWLISPAIKLEAGKKYHFAIDAKSEGANFPEKFEVKLGTEAKASALTQSVISEVTVSSPEFATYENENISVAETGYYHFGIHATSDADQFRLTVANFLVEAGADVAAPDAVTNLSVVATENKLEATVSFTAPTKTVGGDDLTDLTQIDILRDGAVIKSLTEGVAPGAELSYVDNDAALTIGTHVYQVVPYNTTGIGIKSEEVSVFLSAVIQVPYVVDFTQSGSLDVFNVIDANDDGKTWKWSASSGAFYTYNSDNAADDYLVSMPIHFVAGKNYNLTVNAKGSTKYPERFEVKLGKAATVDGLDKTILPATVANAGAYVDYEGSFSVEEDGDYFVAIHAISDADMSTLSVAKLIIVKGAEPTAPAAVTDFTVTAGAQGALEANVSFTAPTTFVNGATATGTLNVDIYRDDVVVKTLENIAYGSEQNWKDENVESGKVYTYQVVPSNADGAGLKSDKISVFVGIDELGGVDNFVVAGSSASTITFTWDPVAGAHGGYVNTDAVVYTIYSMHIEEVEIIPGYTMQELVADEPITTVTGVTTATVDYNTLTGDQRYQYFGISASDGNTTTDPAESYDYAMVGAPYELPIQEGFTGKTLHYLWDSNGGLGLDTQSSDDDACALKLYNNGTSSEVFFVLPRVNLKAAANPTIIFDARNGQNVDKIKVVGAAEGGELTVLGEFNLTAEYTSIKQALSSIKDGTYSSVGILATIPTASVSQYEDNVIIDNIRIVDLYEYDLSINVKAPASVKAGQTAAITAIVKNEGENAATDYTVTVKAGEKVLTTVIGDEALAPFASDEITVDFETSVFDEAGDLTITAEVAYENDLNEDNNSATAILTVKEPTAAAPTSLLAENNGTGGVDLTWTVASDATPTQVTEDFENTEVFGAFDLGGITAEEHVGEFGDWSLYDGNGITVYGFNNIEFPNAYQVAAWQVFSTVGEGAAFAENYGAHSGDQYLISFCPAEENNLPAADHWLISPLLSGDAQTISFYARTLTDQYGAETFEVWASSTDKNVTSFTKVQDFSTTALEWTEFTAALPAGTKYFAIRHTSTDVFGLLVDDVTFVASGGAEAPASFNIYLDKSKLASVAGDKTSYTADATGLALGEHTFALTAVYANGAESKPVTATVTITTGIHQIAADGKAVDIYSLDGKLVRSQATSLDGLKGFYIVNGKTIMIK
jgi:hypothetical protein